MNILIIFVSNPLVSQREAIAENKHFGVIAAICSHGAKRTVWFSSKYRCFLRMTGRKSNGFHYSRMDEQLLSYPIYVRSLLKN